MHDEKRREFYSKAYKEGVTKITNQEAPKLEIVLEWMKAEVKDKKCRIVDIGCSEGVFLEHFRRNIANCEFIGVDISDAAIKGVKKRGFKGHVCDLETEQLPFKSESIDGVYCGDIIEHIFDIDRFLAELKRVLKGDGWTIFTTPNIASLANRLRLFVGQDLFMSHIENIEHVRFFTCQSIKQLLVSKSFKVEKLITRNLVIPYFARIRIIKNGLGNLGEKIILMVRK